MSFHVLCKDFFNFPPLSISFPVSHRLNSSIVIFISIYISLSLLLLLATSSSERRVCVSFFWEPPQTHQINTQFISMALEFANYECRKTPSSRKGYAKPQKTPYHDQKVLQASPSGEGCVLGCHVCLLL